MTEPEEKPLRRVSFILHATRGLIRDQKTRRTTMFALIVVALVLLFSGTTFLQSALNPREHLVWFILFWIVCGWLTVTALLLAVFDMLMLRLETRREQSALRENLKRDSRSTTPPTNT